MDIRQFWRDVLAQDAEALARWFHPDAVVCWHCTNERFTAAEFIRANCAYPGDWDGKIERVEQCGDLIITAVCVRPKDGGPSFHAASFIRVEDGKIRSIDEYWGDDGPAPQWRRDLKIGTPIH